MLHMVPCCKLASFPWTPRPAFCRLPFCKQQEVRGQSEKESTQSTLWILYPRKLHTHMKYKSIPAAATYWAYKFSCKYGLFMPSRLPHCTKHKYYTQYRKKGCLQIVSRQKSQPFSRNSIMGEIICSTIGGFQAINASHRTPIWPLASLMKTPPLWVAILSAWRRSVLPCCKMKDLFSTHLEFPIHSLWPAAEVLPQPTSASH